MERMHMFVGMQMLGFMMKTGACPQDGDIKNMVKASLTAQKEIADVADQVETIERNAEAKRYGRPR